MLVTDFILSYILKISKRYGRYICCFGIFACFYLFSVTQKKHKLLFRYPLKSLSLLSWTIFIFFMVWCLSAESFLEKKCRIGYPSSSCLLSHSCCYFSCNFLLLRCQVCTLFFAFAYFKFLFYSSIGFHKDWVFSALAPFSALGVLF